MAIAESIHDLPRETASSVKEGWRSIVKSVKKQGTVLITNHGEPEVVVISVEEDSELMQAARMAADKGLDALRLRFDERLASLSADDAGRRLRKAMATAPRLHGKVKAGKAY